MKNKFISLLSLIIFSMSMAQAQSPCSLYLNTDFDSECLITAYIKERPGLWGQGLEDCMLACKGNTVQYTAVCPNGIQYMWTISGAASYYLTNQNRTAVVTWGNGDVANISVNVVTADSSTCTAETCVLLMESPHIASSTIPYYYIDQTTGDKVIDVCMNETVELIDSSTAGQTPIVGHYWETPFGNASTPNHTITVTQPGHYTIEHRVQNECGCEDVEVYILNVSEDIKLALSCYGTVCAGAQETYTLMEPHCSQYMWSVEGGTYTVDPTNSATINVQWGNPSNGYGVISIDANYCDSPCKALASIKIPVISSNTQISGPDVVCVGDVQQFELPVWGSTSYNWEVIPSSGFMVANTEEVNQILIKFTQTGTYTLKANYECEFIGCGPYSSSKTIVVKDTMSINSQDSILCKGSTGGYTTWHGNPVTWRVYNQSTNQLLFTTNGIALAYNFANSGNYKVVASSSYYCDDAEYLVTVLANPPALSSTDGPHTACTNSSISLSGSPTHPNYFLVWEPVCSSALPTSVEGNTVTINFENDVCDVAVYQVDNEYGCRSTAFVHEVNLFQLAPHGLPAVTTACAGSVVQLSVPNQSSKVTYEWTINPANAASVIGDHFQPTVNILTNHLSNATPPYLVNVTLKRTYCDDIEVYETVQLSIEDVQSPTISYPDTVCQYEPATFSTTEGTLVTSHYTWQFSDTSTLYHGPVITRSFSQDGLVDFTLSYRPDPNCDPAVVHGQLYVQAAPSVAISFSGTDLSVPYQPGYAYVWTFDNNEVSYTSTCPVTYGYGTYCCTVTTNTTPSCHQSSCYIILPPQPDTCETVDVHVESQDCNVFVLSADSTLGLFYSWSLSISSNGSHCTPSTSHNTATAYFYVPGTHYVNVSAELDGQCYNGVQQVTVDCVPKIELSYNCNGYIVIKDKSLYRSGYPIPVRTLSMSGFGSIQITYPSMSDSIYIGNPTSTTYTVVMTMAGNGCTCSKSITLEPDPEIGSINIPNDMCANVPFLFSATASGSAYYWEFGDGSSNMNNGIFHTYKPQSTENYTVTLTAYNNLGCSTSEEQLVTVYLNHLNGTLEPLSPNPVCPGAIRTIQYTQYLNSALYYWYQDGSLKAYNANRQYNAYETGDYKVKVVESLHGCQVERSRNIGFYNEPIARITGNTEYCFGERVKLKGNTGSNNQYFWYVSGPQSFSFTSQESNISFVPTYSGPYYATIIVTSPDGCMVTATCTLTVHQQPAAPSISFSGNKCIHNPPVEVHSNGGQSLLWSNGYHGVTAYYYVPGFISAYYIDPATGCPSARKQMFIPPAPNYDALLTGCYEKCPNELTDSLHVYCLYPYHDSLFHWYWYRGVTLVDSDTTINPGLIFSGFGQYYLNSHYGDGCSSTSPTLNISKKEACPCEDITVSVRQECYEKDCKLYYKLSVTLCDTGTQSVTFDQLITNSGSNIVSVTSLPVTVVPGGGCQTIIILLEYDDYANGYIEFTLYDSQRNCEKTFTEYLDWRKCIRDGCVFKDYTIKFLELSSTQYHTSYFNVQFTLPSNTTDLVAMWSEPSQLLSYNYLPFTNVDATLMLSYGLLTQMAANSESICFHAILCIDKKYLCHAEICVPAKYFLEKIPEYFRQFLDSTTDDSDSTRNFQSSSFIPQIDKPYLAPNPARDEVTVMGIAPEEVAEIIVLNMQGREVADVHNDYRFNVSRLAKASYIVRVVTTDKQVYYLKLVKQ